MGNQKQHHQKNAQIDYEDEFNSLDKDIRDAVNALKPSEAYDQWWENFERWINRKALLKQFECELGDNPEEARSIYSSITKVEKDIAKCESISNTILRRRPSNPEQGAKDIADSIMNNGVNIRPPASNYSSLERRRLVKQKNDPKRNI